MVFSRACWHFGSDEEQPGFVIGSSGSGFPKTSSTLPLSRAQTSAGQPCVVPPHRSPGPARPLVCRFSYRAHF